MKIESLNYVNYDNNVKPKYVVRRIYRNQFGVINTETGELQAAYKTLQLAREVARDLNKAEPE